MKLQYRLMVVIFCQRIVGAAEVGVAEAAGAGAPLAAAAAAVEAAAGAATATRVPRGGSAVTDGAAAAGAAAAVVAGNYILHLATHILCNHPFVSVSQLQEKQPN